MAGREAEAPSTDETNRNVAATTAELPQNRRSEKVTRGRIAYFVLGALIFVTRQFLRG
jgi:hypothetical protein